MRMVYIVYAENFNMNASFHSAVSVCLRLCGQIPTEIRSLAKTEVLGEVETQTKWALSLLSVWPGTPPSSTATVWLWTHTLWFLHLFPRSAYLWGQLGNCPAAVLGASQLRGRLTLFFLFLLVFQQSKPSCLVLPRVILTSELFLHNSWISEIISQLCQIETFKHVQFKWD